VAVIDDTDIPSAWRYVSRAGSRRSIRLRLTPCVARVSVQLRAMACRGGEIRLPFEFRLQ